MRERILIVDDEPGPREGLRRLLEAWGYSAVTASSGDEALELMAREKPTAIITDLVMPGLAGLAFLERIQAEHPVPVIVFSGQGTIEHAVEAIKRGAQDFLEKPVEPAKLKILLEKLAGARALLADNRRLRDELRKRGAFGRLLGVSRQMQSVFRLIDQVAPSTLSVLVVGESGTGKELVAQTIHDLSPRKKQPFVAINCAAIPATLLESEIFGHERGSFTGAVERKIGCFEMAHQGTLFLDEIAEMDPLLQAKLLRVLQDQKFRRVGGRDVVEANVRVIAATNRDPQRAIAEGRLREDLYYRLNVFSILLPPLRERREDIPHLAQCFAADYAARAELSSPTITPDAMGSLLAHSWPGNARELKNAIERATLLGDGTTILREHLPPEVAALSGDPTQVVSAAPVESKDFIAFQIGGTMEEAEEQILRRTLEHTSGNKTQAAKILRISLKTVHTRSKRLLSGGP